MWLHGLDPIKLSYHPTKFGGHRQFGSGDMFLVYQVSWRSKVTGTYFISLIDWNPVYALGCQFWDHKSMISHIAIFLISVIPIYNSEVLDTARRKRKRRRRRRRTQAIVKRYVFHANAQIIFTNKAYCRETFLLLIKLSSVLPSRTVS